MDQPDTAGDPTGDPVGTEGCSAGPDPLLFLQALQTLWSTRELRQLREEARRGFAALVDPRTMLLDVLESSGGWRRKGRSLEAWLTWELAHWLPAQPLSGRAQGSSGLKQLQARAVRVLAESPPGLVEPLISIFQLQDADRGPLLTHVHWLHQEGPWACARHDWEVWKDGRAPPRCCPLPTKPGVTCSVGDRQAALLGLKLRLQPLLDVEKMSAPLLLQDEMALAERYVAGFPDLQRRLLALLDSWCQPSFDIRVVARQLPQVTPLRPERLSPGVLSRQVLRLLERQGLDPALCPHAVAQQRLAALRHLCHEHFVEGSWSQENWTEHVQALVGRDDRLQDELLRWLASADNQAVAARCALDLSLPEAQLPASVAAELHRLKLQGRAAEARSESRRDDYYQLPIARGDVHFLASWEDLARHEEALLQPGQVLAVDLEWRPSFGTGGRPQASIMQLAVKGRVFLLDLPVLSRPVGGQVSQAFSRLVSQMLSDPSITKLGYGMSGDLRSLGASCPALAHVEKRLQGGLDLLRVHRQMRVADKPALGRGKASGLRGLSLLVQQVLGKPLDKAQQLSNWDRRPLSEGQLVYAAADAYCLLEVYQALCREPARFCLSEDLARSLRPASSERSEAWEPPSLREASASAWLGRPSGLSPPSRPGRGPGARGLPSQAAWQEPVAEKQDAAPEIPVRAFRAVCDSMLHGLARSLRCLGADVLTLGTGEDHRRAAEVARQEGRIVLTSGLPYHKLRAQVGAGRCLAVDCSLKARQQAKAVLKHFNVRVTPADIFSRCQACNCDQYLKVSKEMMKQLVWLGSHPEGPSSTGDEASPSADLQEAGSAPEEAPGSCTHDLPCRWLEAADLQSHAPAVLGNGTRLRLAGVPEGVLRRPGPRPFYCCTGCGKVFWEGSHLGRITTHFREVLDGVSRPCPASGPS